MNCKNCNDVLKNEAAFCGNCGGKVITYRITFKQLLVEFFTNIFGIDSKYFLTLKKMFTQPQEVLNEYLSGVRKRYVNPFAYLAVGAALSLIVFNFFSNDFLKTQEALSRSQNPEMYELAEADDSIYANLKGDDLKKLKAKQQTAKFTVEMTRNYSRFMLHYLNLLAFIFLPLYTLLSKLTYFKPYNFGEHIVMNAYLQGSTMLISVVTFLISLVTTPILYTFSIILYIIYYSFAFKKLYRHSTQKTILKTLKFLGVLIAFILVLMILGIIIATVFAVLGGFKPPM